MSEKSEGAPTHTYEELHDMTVASLREIAKGIEHDAVKGYSTMHKEHLLLAICEALGIDPHVHHEVVGIDKASIKRKMRELKKERDRLIEAKDKKALKLVRRRIRSLNRKIHKATV